MAASPSLTARALLAVGLLVGFYVLALGIIAALLGAVWAEIEYAHRLDLRLGLFCVGTAAMIGIAVMPRRDVFTPPGPKLEPAKQPRLFQTLRDVAREVGQPLPDDVFLIFDVNAWVAQRGGVMGFGSRPVMALGLPLMQVLSVSELQAVIAHEFGHFSGADTRLGPWIYKTRAAIGRTLQSLSDSLMRKPFEWYGYLFMRLTQSVSRAQELAADARAAQIAGAGSLVSSLRRLEGAGQVFNTFFHQELVPLLNGGFRPPIADGFARFTRAPRIANAMEAIASHASTTGESSKLDSHPSLREREESLANAPRDGILPSDSQLAVSLLEGLPELELGLLGGMLKPGVLDRLNPLEWEAAGGAYWAPFFAAHAREQAAGLAGVTAGALPALVADARAMVNRFPRLSDGVPLEAAAQRVTWLYAAALTSALARTGWELHAAVGEDIALRRDGEEVRPFSTLVALRAADASETRARFESLCARAGISALSLAPPPAES